MPHLTLKTMKWEFRRGNVLFLRMVIVFDLQLTSTTNYLLLISSTWTPGVGGKMRK